MTLPREPKPDRASPDNRDHAIDAQPPPPSASWRITPARIDFDGGAPRALDFDDIYRPAGGDAFDQARRVFLAGNDLPARWRGRDRFTILEIGFGLGHNILALLEAWLADPPRQRCTRLHIVSIEKHPPTRGDLERGLQLAAPSPPATPVAAVTAAATDATPAPVASNAASPTMPGLVTTLLAQWPPATSGMHRLRFADGAATLDLVFADVIDAVRDLVCVADAVFLDGFAPARNAAMWSPALFRGLARLSADDATAATWSVARAARDGLRLAGFDVERVAGCGGKRQVLEARRRALPPGRRRHDPLARLGSPVFAADPRGTTRERRVGHEDRPPGDDIDVLVVGAGLAGAHAAAALARRGLRCTVVDRHDVPAQEASGGAGGIFHGTVHAADNLHARLHRAASIEATRLYRALIAEAGSGGDRTLPGAADGLLRMSDLDLPTMQAQVEAQGLPADWIRAVDAEEASRMAGVVIDRACWFFPQAGWISPQALVRRLLRHDGITFRGGVEIARVDAVDGGWHGVSTDGTFVARARACVLANAARATALAPWACWPLGVERGQSSRVRAGTPGLAAPRVPIGSKGYALTLDDGSVICGASAHRGDHGAEPRVDDTLDNLAKLERLTGSRRDVILASARNGRDEVATIDRVAWRSRTSDRLPIVGAVPAPIDTTTKARAASRHQARRVARAPGLYVLTGLGSRGLTLAPLLGEVLAASILREPVPLEASILDAIDAARFV